MDRKQRASLFAISSVFVLSIIKFSIGLYSNSVAVISSALDNFQDIFMSSVNYFAIRKAAMPPDKNHKFGHGKFEDLSSFFVSLVILLTGIFVIYKALVQFLKKEPLKSPSVAIAIMVLSFFWSFIIAYYLKRVGEKTDSPALKSDSIHYLTDVYSNGGAIVAIILSSYLGYHIFDPLIGIIIGLIILFSSISIFKEGIVSLTDMEIKDELKQEIDKIITDMPYPYAGYHRLRTRTSGGKKHIDFHLLTCRRSSIEEAHNLSDRIEEEIESKIKNTDIVIHLEPCPYTCELTVETCRVRKMGIVKW